MEAVKGWLGRDVQAALDALEKVPLKIDTHAQWMEVRRNLLNCQKTIQWLAKLASLTNLGAPSEDTARTSSGNTAGSTIDIAKTQRRHSAVPSRYQRKALRQGLPRANTS